MALKGYGRSSRSKSWSFAPSPFHGVDEPSAKALSTLQVAQLLYRAHQKPHRSFVGKLEHGLKIGASPLLWTLHEAGRTYHMSAAVADELGKKKVSLSSALAHPVRELHREEHAIGRGIHRGLIKNENIGFGDVLKKRGLPGVGVSPKTFQRHKVLRAATGFGLDVLADPLTYATLGTSSIAGKTAEHAAARAVASESGRVLSHMSKTEASKALKALAPHVHTLENAGDNFVHHAALGRVKMSLLRRRAVGETIHVADRSLLNTAKAAAHAEERATIARGLHLRVAGLKTKPLPVPLPSMEKIAGAKIPVVSKLYDKAGKAFVPHYQNRIMHSALIGRKHQGERITGEYLNVVRKELQGHANMSEKDMLKALHHFEKKGGVIPHGDSFVLNPKRIEEARKAGVTAKQLDFVQRMHTVSEYLAKEHVAYGVEFKHQGLEGKMYVPHILLKDGSQVHGKYASLLTKRGFQKARKGDFTLHQLAQMKRAGELPNDVETNPYKLLTMAARASAHKHADQTMQNYLVQALGKPSHLVDTSALSKAQRRMEELQQQIAEHPASVAGARQEMKQQLARSIANAKASHEHALELKLQDTLKHNKALIKDHMNRDQLRTTMATVQRISNRSARAKAQHAADLKLLKAGKYTPLDQHLTELASMHEEPFAELKGLKDELNSISTKTVELAAGKKNPAAHGLVPVDGLKDANGKVYHFEPEVAEAIQKVERVMAGDEATIQGFNKAYRKWLSKWKVAVTSVNPSYGIRNTLSDAWNMWLDGVPGWAMPVYGAKAAHLMAQAKHGNVDAVAEMLDMYDHGILSGLFPGDIQTVSWALQHGGSKRALLLRKDPRVIKAYSKMMQDFNRNRENWGRVTHYLYRREYERMSTVDAAEHVKAAHFDYEDLTPFEQQKLKSIAPFYTWTRKNIPFQVKSLFMAPGRFEAFPKLASESEHAAGPQPGSTPDYLQKAMAFRTPFGGAFALPMIGVTDLTKADPRNAVDTAGGLLTPFVKAPMEMALNRSLYTGQEIAPKGGHPRSPVGSLGAKVLSLIPGSNVGTTERGGVHGPGANPYYAYLLGQLGPAANTFLLKGQNPIAQSTQLKHKQLLAYLSGINLTKVDPKRQKQMDELNFQDQWKSFLRGVRDEGKLPEPKKRKKSKNQHLLEDTLAKRYAGR